MNKFSLVVLASLAFANGALAQAPAKIDPATVQAVNELLVSMKYDEVLKSSIKVMADQMPANMLAGATAAINGNAKLTDEQKRKELDKVTREMPKIAAAMNELMNDPSVIEEMIVEMGPLYARHFTLDEIRQLAAFYRSPLGTKILTTMPAVLNESMALGQKVMIPRVERLVQQLHAK